MNKKPLWITETAVLIALLVALQWVTKPLGQFVTGSCVNLVLVVATLVGGLWCGVTVAVLSPFFAYFIGIAPAPHILLVPAIALGNVVLVLVYAFLYDKLAKGQGWKSIAGRCAIVVIAAVCKFLVLFVVIVRIMLPLLGLKPPQVAALTTSFSWPQLVTALIGGAVAVCIVPLLRKALGKKK